MFERIKRWLIHRAVGEDTKMNVVSIARGSVIRKIKRLEDYQKDYEAIKKIKQHYLKCLQHHKQYATINIECHNLNEQIKLLDKQLVDMDVKLIMLKKELKC